MPRLMRCLAADLAVSCERAEYGRRMGAGAVVDFDEVIIPAQGKKPAYTLGDALRGREDCFEAVPSALSGAAARSADAGSHPQQE